MKIITRLLISLEFLTALFGAYDEIAPESWPFRYLPKGMGTALSLISVTMMVVLLNVELDRQQREANSDATLFRAISQRMSASLPFHEREFFAIWPEQVRRAQDTVDVAYLSPRPPPTVGSGAQEQYFGAIHKIYKASNAHVRRVERLSSEKRDWLRRLVRDFTGLHNVSLAVYRDQIDAELPAPISVCRSDDQYAWLVALAEHESTGKYRDVLLTGSDVVGLIRTYFQNRLWLRSTVIINRGQVQQDWEKELD